MSSGDEFQIVEPQRLGLRALGADLQTGIDTPGTKGVLKAVLTVRFLAVALFRLSQSAGNVHWIVGAGVKQLNHLITGADIAWEAMVGPGLQLYHPTGVVIGPHVRLGGHAVLQQGVTIGGDGGTDAGIDSSPTVGDNVRFGPGARVFGRVTVGDNVVIGANSVVVKDIPSDVTVVGVPARILPDR